MSSRMSVSLATAGALAITTVMFPAFGSPALDRSAVTTEFSADNQQQKQEKQNKQQERKQFQQGPHQQIQQDRKVQKQQFQQDRKVQKQEFQQDRKVQKQEFRQDRKTQQIEKKEFKQGQRREFTRSGNNAVVVGSNFRGISRNGGGQFRLRDRNFSVWGGGHRWQGSDGRWRTYVALGALGVLAIGAYEYYPYAYIDAPQPYCEGLTEDGCQLDFQDVQTVEGDVVGQCVAYCPWQ
jgi:hypothetical protein